MSSRSERASRREETRTSIFPPRHGNDGTQTSLSQPSQSTSAPAPSSKPPIPPAIRLKLVHNPKPKPEKQKLTGKTICISTFLTAADLASMPLLSPSLLKSTTAHNRRLSKSKPHPHSPSDASAEPKSTSEKRDREHALERNIDTVIFGDVAFKSWYPSWYPKEIIGEKALLAPVSGSGSGEGKSGIVVKELYVCKRCFGYGKVVLEWVRHTRVCEREVPGRQIYVHGGEEGEGTWSVWEVDGGLDTLFCQNLSLFAKLFLDNKSVFFDVSGFNYFLLVHSSPSSGEQQIVGFFSKEKMSWDNNNLACILIFPPWQRKGLGTILMGVSYEISRREEIMGGPEKPISDLGKKGYKRFWGAEIARWLLEVKETDRKKGRGMVDVERISRETWIAPEDALMVLRDMGVVEKAGRGKGMVERVRIDKVLVREWVTKEKLGLQRVVDDHGFLEGYGYRRALDEEEGD